MIFGPACAEVGIWPRQDFPFTHQQSWLHIGKGGEREDLSIVHIGHLEILCVFFYFTYNML